MPGLREMTDQDILDWVWPFGQKHAGETIWQIAQCDPLYLDWAQDVFGGVAGSILRRAVELPEVSRLIDRAVG